MNNFRDAELMREKQRKAMAKQCQGQAIST